MAQRCPGKECREQRCRDGIHKDGVGDFNRFIIGTWMTFWIVMKKWDWWDVYLDSKLKFVLNTSISQRDDIVISLFQEDNFNKQYSEWMRQEKDQRERKKLISCSYFVWTSQTWSCSVLPQLYGVGIISCAVEITGHEEAWYIVHGWRIGIGKVKYKPKIVWLHSRDVPELTHIGLQELIVKISGILWAFVKYNHY